MATYVPNATQTTEPVEGRTVESAALEFRTLKTSVNARVASLQSELDGTQVDLAGTQTTLVADELRITALEQLAFNGSTPGATVSQEYVATGLTGSFTLGIAPLTVASVDVFVNGLSIPPSEITVVGAVVTLAVWPVAGDKVVIKANIPLQLGITTADQVEFIQSGTGAVATTVQSKLRESVSVKDFGAKGDGVTNDSAAFALAVAAVPTNGTLYFPAGVFCGYLRLWRSDIAIIGAGSGATTIKLPNSCPSITVPWEAGGTITGLPNVIEVGECALGNTANSYSRVVIQGMTIDGNYTNNSAPVTDLFGHGVTATKISYLFIDDVVAQNCYLTGIDCVINSNYARINARVDNCGQAALNYPNFDINSSKYGKFDIISSGGKYGGRMLDNCWGNKLDISVYNPAITGLVYNNQTANASYSNTINVSVVDGCNSGQGVSIGVNCHNSIVNATIRNVTGTGFYVSGGSATYAPRGNTFNVNTYYCGSAAVNEAGISNQYNITSRWDGRAGAAGSVFAVDINGSYNQFTINLEDQAVPQVRGVAIRSGAQYNNIIDYKYNANVQAFLNQDTGNTTRYDNIQIPYANNAGIWQSVTLNAGWSNTFGAPYPSSSCIIDSTGRVSMRGTVNGGIGTICTLPAGYRPLVTMLFPTIANAVTGRLSVDSAGDVTLTTGTATSVDLSTISFYTY